MKPQLHWGFGEQLNGLIHHGGTIYPIWKFRCRFDLGVAV